MSKPPKLSLKSIVAASVTAQQNPVEAAVVRLEAAMAPQAPKPQAPLKERARQMSVYLEPPVYDQLRDIAFTERAKMHGLMLEALDLLFKARGALSIKQLNDRASRSN